MPDNHHRFIGCNGAQPFGHLLRCRIGIQSSLHFCRMLQISRRLPASLCFRYPNVLATRQFPLQKTRHFACLLMALCRQRPRQIAVSFFRMCMPPQNQLHDCPPIFSFYFEKTAAVLLGLHRPVRLPIPPCAHSAPYWQTNPPHCRQRPF